MGSLKMEYYCLIFYIFVLAPTSQKKTEDVTLNVHDRVNLLKHQIAEQIQQKQRTSELILPIDSDDEEYAYVDSEKQPITPIMDFDERKKGDQFKMKEIVTTSTSTKKPGLVQRAKKKRKLRGRNRMISTLPYDSFYRRLLSDLHTPVQWLHCQDLISPFLKGYKNDITVAKRLTTSDHSVMRLLQLLKLNTTGHTKEEIYSILYQISNLQIRLFQWDVTAISALLNILVKDKPHTFKHLIHGVRKLLGSWHLDIGNTTNLLKQARIFRPPCVKVSEYGGSTKTSKSVRYTRSTTPKPTCAVPGAKECNVNTLERYRDKPNIFL